MSYKDAWVPFSWHCPNCGTIVTGFKNQNGDIKVQCKKCKAVMVRTTKNKQRDRIEIFAPTGQERIAAG